MAASELPIRIGVSATRMAEEIFGDGVTVVSASYTGDNRSSGIYSNGDTVSPVATPGDTGVILSTGRARDFTNSNGAENQDENTTSNTNGPDDLPDFNAAAGTTTRDTAFLDVDFIPDGNVMTMQFVFSSEEYPEFQDSIYQDFVGVWVNGQKVSLGVGNGDTDPGNINSIDNQNLYVDNAAGTYNTEMDGFTVTLSLTMLVNPDEVNSIRIGIADVADNNYDSALLIAGDSIQTVLIANDDAVSLLPNDMVDFDVLGNDINATGAALVITHINGLAVAPGDTVTLATGQTVSLNGDGTLNLVGDGDIENYNFTYTVSNGTATDTGIVNVSQIPCFVAGTLIATPNGEVPVDRLTAGDLVMTKDDGPQPLRWIGTRNVPGIGHFAPISIDPNTFGLHRALLLSPLHRVLIRDSFAELLFGEAEVLVAARDLINDRSVRRREGGRVTYVHLLFDRHQVVFSEGLATESYLPGPQTAHSFEQSIVDEIRALFPELDPDTGYGYGPSARRSLRRFEAQLLLNHGVAA